MNTFTRIFDKATSGIYFALLCILALIWFGSGVYASLSAKRTERAELAIAQKIERAKVGQHIRVNGVGLLKTSHHAGRVE